MAIRAAAHNGARALHVKDERCRAGLVPICHRHNEHGEDDSKDDDMRGFHKGSLASIEASKQGAERLTRAYYD